MIRPTLRLVCLCAALALSLPSSAQPLPPDTKVEMTLEEALGRAAVYESGQSRLPISIVADHIVRLNNAGDARAAREFSLQLIGHIEAYWASVEGRRELLRQLAKLAGREAVPALEKAVKDPTLWDVALMALEDVPSREADAALRRLLSETEGRTRLGVIQTLGLRGDSGSLDPLAALLKDAGEETPARAAAARALAHIGGPKARDGLLAVRQERSGTLREELTDALLLLAQGFEKQRRFNRAYPLYQRLYDPAESPAVQSAALLGLFRTLSPGRADALWVEAMAGAPAHQRAAIEAAAWLRGRRSTQVVAGRLAGLPSELQAPLLRALAERGDAAAAPAIAPLARAGAPEVRVVALAALGRLGDADAVPGLVANLEDENKDVAGAARAALDRLTGKGVDLAVLAQLEAARRAETRAQLAACLAARNAWQTAPDLLLLAERDESGAVRAAALTALGDLGREWHVDDLLALLLAAKTDEEREAAENSIVKIARNNEDTTARARPVLAVWPRGQGAARLSLARILGRLQGKEAEAALIAALAHDNEDVSLEALRALSEWNDPGPRETLRGLARSEARRSRQVLALRGYIRQSGMDARDDRPAAVGRLQEAMTLATRAEERRMALSEVGKIADPAALALALRHVDDEALQNEAVAAVMDIARALGARQRDLVVPAVEKCLPLIRDERQRASARDFLTGLKNAQGTR